MVLSDYAKGALTRELCERVIRAARHAGVPVLADPKTPDLSKYSGATVVCPNLQELSLATGVPPHEMEALLRQGRRSGASTTCEYLAVTMSEQGIRLLSERASTIRRRGRARCSTSPARAIR